MRRQLRGVDTANAIRMTRTHYRSKAFLVVEGDDDRGLFRWHVDTSACHVEACYGREKVVEAILILDADRVPGVLGIVDADFMVLDNVASPSPNIVLTDYHDVECMLLASPALHHVLHELGTAMQIEAFEATQACNVLDYLQRVGRVIGHLRWASHRRAWSLKFDGIDFSKFVNERSLVLDEDALLEEVHGHQGGRTGSPPTTEGMSEAVREIAALNANCWHVCRGHDLVEILALGLRRVLGAQNEAEVKPERLELMLRLAYEKKDFASTNLWVAMRAWEVANAPFRIF